tara:strand:+ start:1323 stop:1592 length:270 start_codon:yes stop_codon:yes gene_type:complete
LYICKEFKNKTIEIMTLHEINTAKEKVWITFLDNGFEEFWMPLTDWEGNQLLWCQKRQAKKVASEKFSCKWGLSPCNQKELNHASIDNF